MLSDDERQMNPREASPRNGDILNRSGSIAFLDQVSSKLTLIERGCEGSLWLFCRCGLSLGARGFEVTPTNSTEWDHGPEFESQVLDTWAYEHGLRLNFIRPREAGGERVRREFQRPISRRVPE
jgi:hypothetical protein